MHGRKRAPAGSEPSAEAAAAVSKKVATYRQLGGLAMKHRTANARAPDAFELNGKLLAVNPDVYSLWNYRRECLLDALRDADEAATAAAVAGELKVTEAAIGKNPKSYPAWHHRQWVVGRFYRPHVSLAKELALCGALLDADERNFHCWNYRRWVAELGGVPPADELDYTRHRIGINFSNYSAWHYRTYLLPRVHAAPPPPAESEGAAAAPDEAAAQPAQPPAAAAPLLPLGTLRGELELLRQAVFTEPDDQSPWFYRRWVLAQVERHFSTEAAAAAEEARDEAGRLLREDVDSLRELAALEPGSKWPLLGIAQALAALHRAGLAAVDGGSGGEGPAYGSLRLLYSHLEGMDAMHAAYYRHCAGQLPPGE